MSYRIRVSSPQSVEFVSESGGDVLATEPGEYPVKLDALIEAVHPDDRRRFRQMLAQPPSERCARLFRMIGADGTTIRTRHTLHPISGQDGQIDALEAVLVEHTHDWDLPFESIVETINDGILVVDFSGNIVYANLRMAEMLGYTRQQMTGQRLFDFMDDKWAQRARANLERRKRGVEDVFDHQFRHREGHEVWTLVSTRLMDDEDGEHRGSLVAIRDISERKRTASELDRVSKQLLQTSHMAGMAEVASGVLHNVGNVLNSLSVSVTMISERLTQSKVSEVGRLAKLFSKHADDLPGFFADNPSSRTIPDFLTMLDARLGEEREEVRTEIGELEERIRHIKNIIGMQQQYARPNVHRERILVERLFDDATKIYQRSFERHGIELVIDASKAPPQGVCLESHRTLLILVNLLNNARQAVDAAQVEDKRIELRYEPVDDSTFQLSVSDNGVGIKEEHLDQIFRHGFTTRDDGHGFGLHSSANAAAAMNGTLEMHSPGPGQGATFTLELPRTDPEKNNHAGS